MSVRVKIPINSKRNLVAFQVDLSHEKRLCLSFLLCIEYIIYHTDKPIPLFVTFRTVFSSAFVFCFHFLDISNSFKGTPLFFFPLASRNVSDWWLAYWISHSRVTNSTADHLNSTTKYNLNHVILSALNHVQSGLRVHIVKNTVTFYLLVYGGLAVANTVS